MRFEAFTNVSGLLHHSAKLDPNASTPLLQTQEAVTRGEAIEQPDIPTRTASVGKIAITAAGCTCHR